MKRQLLAIYTLLAIYALIQFCTANKRINNITKLFIDILHITRIPSPFRLPT